MKNIIPELTIIACLFGAAGIGIASHSRQTATSREYLQAARIRGRDRILPASNCSTVHLVRFADAGAIVGSLGGNIAWMAIFLGCPVLRVCRLAHRSNYWAAPAWNARRDQHGRVVTSQTHLHRTSGFALVVTLSMMALLTIIAVGLLSLASVGIRNSNSSESSMRARANARLALQLAIGQLQLAAGSDQRVTASANLRDPSAPMGLTGVWSSWRPQPGTTGGYSQLEKDKRFLGWLISTTDPADQLGSEVPTPAEGRSILLIGDGSLGSESPNNAGNHIRGERIEVAHASGYVAWATLDEGVKARLDLPARKNPGSDLASRAATVGAADRDAVWNANHLDRARTLITAPGMLATYGQADLLFEDRNLLAPYFNDFSVVSQGLLTNTADGGLKEDLSLLFGENGDRLPADYNGTRLYSARNGVAGSRANPYWSMLQDFATSYQRLVSINGEPGIRSRVGVDQALGGSVAGADQPRKSVLAPVIARIEMVFSLIGRDAHGNWKDPDSVPNKPYLLHLLYSPVVTLYNPYNVPVSVSEMHVEFSDLPIGFRFYRGGEAMNTELIPLNALYAGNYQHGFETKTFKFTLKEEISGSTMESILDPGATRVFGINADPDLTFATKGIHQKGGIHDWQQKNLTNDFVCARGWTQGMGFDVDWLAPVDKQTPAFKAAGVRGVIHCGARDTIDVEYGPVVPETLNGKNGVFTVNVSFGSGRSEVNYSRFEVSYGDINKLTEALKKTTEGDLDFPLRLERPHGFLNIYEPNNVPISDYTRPLPFATFAIQGKTTRESGEWIRTWADSNPTARAARLDLASDGSQACYPVEFSLTPVRPSSRGVDLDAADRGFYFVGHSSESEFGTKVAAAYEIPFAPLQSIAQLRHANLAGSAVRATTTYTVGESRLHPMLPGNEIAASSAKGEVLDHTWLANDALWDRYFFSTIASENGLPADATARSQKTVLQEFLTGKAPLTNPRFVPLAGNEENIRTITDKIEAEDGWMHAAQFIAQNGDFNINSTSRPAWKAVLGGLDSTTISTLALRNEESSSGGSFARDETHISGSAFPRVRRPLETSIDRAAGAGDLASEHIFWRGFRELSTDASGQKPLDRLADEMVRTVRERGPFLSLAEFVNRRIGKNSDEATCKGAIQSAIDHAEINKDFTSEWGYPINADTVADYGYASPEAVEGHTSSAFPGDVTQGDILSLIGSRISARSDTFTIRAYGDATDLAGKVVACAWCEAIVQRLPDYINPSGQPPSASINILNAVNQKFGRRFVITAFRWLSPSEI